jgi:hypothetical protein
MATDYSPAGKIERVILAAARRPKEVTMWRLEKVAIRRLTSGGSPESAMKHKQMSVILGIL